MFNPKTEGRGKVSKQVGVLRPVNHYGYMGGGVGGGGRLREQFAHNNYIALLWGILFPL